MTNPAGLRPPSPVANSSRDDGNPPAGGAAPSRIRGLPSESPVLKAVRHLDALQEVTVKELKDLGAKLVVEQRQAEDPPAAVESKANPLEKPIRFRLGDVDFTATLIRNLPAPLMKNGAYWLVKSLQPELSGTPVEGAVLSSRELQRALLQAAKSHAA